MEEMKEMRDKTRRGEARRQRQRGENKMWVCVAKRDIWIRRERRDSGKNKTRTSGENNIIRTEYNNRDGGEAVGRAVTNEVLGYYRTDTANTGTYRLCELVEVP